MTDSTVDKPAPTAEETPVEEAPAMPKLELKMVLPLIVIFGSKYIDLKEEQNVNYVRIAAGTSLALALSVYFILYKMIEGKGDKSKIYVPPKPAPSLPFMAPPPKPTPDQYEETTYFDHEKLMLWDASTAACSSVGIAMFMSWKFNIHISCLLQAVILPTSFYDNLCCRKYLIGAKGLLYGELLEKPIAPPPKKDTSKYVKPPVKIDSDNVTEKDEANKKDE